MAASVEESGVAVEESNVFGHAIASQAQPLESVEGVEVGVDGPDVNGDAIEKQAQPPESAEETGAREEGSDGHDDMTAKQAQPPPETAEGRRVRSLVIASFWMIVVFLGCPMWWRTTSIHRASLPLLQMSDWADGKACKPSFPLQISVEAPALQENEASHLVHLIQHALDDSNEFAAHHLRLQLSTYIKPLERVNASRSFDTQARGESVSGANAYTKLGRQDHKALTIRLLQEDIYTKAAAELESHSTVLCIRHSSNQMPSTSSSTSALASWIAVQIQDIFAEEQAIIADILTSVHSSSSGGNQPQIPLSVINGDRSPRARSSRTLGPELAARLVDRTTRSLRYAPTYHITISLFSPSAAPSSWEIEEAITDTLTPLLESLTPISNFSVDTQVQVHAAFSPSVNAPAYDTANNVWTLREEDLSGFINAAEWPLSPSIGAGPTLNFILYIPDQSTTPLVVRGSRASSWLIPQWGGVVILNPVDGGNGSANGTANESVESGVLSRDAIKPALLTFSHQLLSFLGAPLTPPSLPLQLQTLTRIQAASLLLSASSTMGSLARLTKALPTISIPETVSSAVDTTLIHLERTCTALKNGQFEVALENARIAEAEAEKGFFEKSMVGQVYFPDEHKLAVYLPLLGPIGVPLIMSALKELKKIVATWKAGRRSPLS